jgi:cytochrome c551/c552
VAKFKRDEQRNFGLLWFVTGGIFAALSVWACWNEIVARTPWRDEQKQFYQVELDQARRNLERQKNLFANVKSYDNGTKTSQQKLDELLAEQKATEAKKSAPDYASAASDLANLDVQYADAEQRKTFAKSDLDEAYYYRTQSDYARDAAELKAREKAEATHPGFGRSATDKAFTDPPLKTSTNCPDKVKAQTNCADMLHLENEKARNESHAKGARDLEATFPDAKDELETAAQKADATVDFISKEITHQTRIDAALNDMFTVDEKRNADKAKMAPVDSKLEELAREIAKVSRPLDDAQRRVKAAEDHAAPKFDIANVIDSLVGVYEIQQIVDDWDSKMEVDRCTTCHMGVDSANYTDLSVPRKFRTHPMRNMLFTTHAVEKFGCTSCHQGQGRATEETFAHSVYRLEPKNGEPRWELTGDPFWEDPMMQIGDLMKVLIDERNDTWEADVGTGRLVTFALPRMTYETENDFLGHMQYLMQQELQKNDALSREWRVRVIRVDGRINVGLEPLTPQAEALAAIKGEVPKGQPKPPAFRIRFTKKPELGDVLGFSQGSHIAGNPLAADGTLKCTPWCSAVLPPSVPVRNDDPIPAEGEWLPPSGRNGMQVPPEFRDRFIQSLPETESGCLKCHAGDTDLRPHKSKAQWILANRDKQLHDVQAAACKDVLAKACDGNDYACTQKRDECTKITSAESPDLGDDPEKMADLAPTLTEGRNLFKRLNCTGCHILDGFPGNRNAGPELDDISAKVSPKWLLTWIRYPRMWRNKTRMPTLWPVPMDPESKRPYPENSAEYQTWNARMRSETLAVAAYLWDRSEHPEKRGLKDGAPVPPPQDPLRAKIETDYSEAALTALGSTAEEGQKIFGTIGCQGCHALADEQAEPWKMRERDIAPNLGNVGSKMSVAWMAYWIEDPARYWHGTRMPKLRLTKAEAGSVAMYLATQKTDPKTKPADVGDDEVAKLQNEETRKTLAAQGSKLIANYGCFGCHQISGFEGYAPIAPELNGFEFKDIHTLDFGYALPDHHQQTLETFTVWKLDSPRIYATDRIELRMADFDLSPKEIRALIVFLKGLAEAKIKPELNPEDDANYKAMMEGKDLVEDFNCRGCHMIEGLGSDIAATIKKGTVGLWQSDDELSKQYGPPSLTAEGLRTQPEWLFGFLRDPGANPIRPFLHPEKFWGGPGQEAIPDDRRALRMPTFNLSEEQTTSIVRYFSGWDGQEYPYQTPHVNELSKDQKLSVLVHLNSNDDGGVRCVQCHYVGELPRDRALADWKALAPNLGNASHRLRPEWVRNWIGNPKDFIAYTKMPPLWTNTSGDADYYGPPKTWTRPAGVSYGMAIDQITAFRDFVFTLKESSRLPEVGAEESSPLVTGEQPETVAATDVAKPADDKGAKGGAAAKPGDKKVPAGGAGAKPAGKGAP